MNWLRLIFFFIATVIKIARPGGVKAVAAENLLLRQQLITLGRCQKQSPNLSTSARLIYGILVALINPKCLLKLAIVIKPSTLLRFHKALVSRKYRLLFSSQSKKKPGPKGPSRELIRLMIEMESRNPQFGYLRIAMQINNRFGIDLDKHVVKRVLDKYYLPCHHGSGPSWFTFIGHAKDSLRSIDFLRVESLLLKSHWVMVVMDQFTRRIIGFSVHLGHLDGTSLCCLFNKIIASKKLPMYLSSDHDPLFTFHRWRGNLRILEIEEIKALPNIPMSHPFIERLIGTIRREYLDRLFFWNEIDLQNKLDKFKEYYNRERSHSSQNTMTPIESSGGINKKLLLNNYHWKIHCKGLFQLPIAA